MTRIKQKIAFNILEYLNDLYLTIHGSQVITTGKLLYIHAPSTEVHTNLKHLSQNHIVTCKDLQNPMQYLII